MLKMRISSRQKWCGLGLVDLKAGRRALIGLPSPSPSISRHGIWLDGAASPPLPVVVSVIKRALSRRETIERQLNYNNSWMISFWNLYHLSLFHSWNNVYVFFFFLTIHEDWLELSLISLVELFKQKLIKILNYWEISGGEFSTVPHGEVSDFLYIFFFFIFFLVPPSTSHLFHFFLPPPPRPPPSWAQPRRKRKTKFLAFVRWPPSMCPLHCRAPNRIELHCNISEGGNMFMNGMDRPLYLCRGRRGHSALHFFNFSFLFLLLLIP